MTAAPSPPAAPTPLAVLLCERRQRKGLTQEEVARHLRMSRTNYAHIEGSHRKEGLSPEQAAAACRELAIDMLELVAAMGYPVKLPAPLPSPEEQRLLDAYRRASPVVRKFLLQGLGI